MRGEKLKGSFALVRTKDAKTWLMIKHRDRFVSDVEVTEQNRSVLSGAAVADLKIVPAHQIPAAQLVPSGDVVAMPKSHRAHARRDRRRAIQRRGVDVGTEARRLSRASHSSTRRRVRLSSRRGVELASAFPQLVAELGKQDANGMILDGELVAFDANGKPSFNAMQNRVQLKTEREIAAADRKSPVVFYCFDLLYFAGIDLRRATYGDRRRYLSQCLLPSPLVQLVHAQDDGIALQTAALASGLEGVIGKRKDSRYETGRRSGAWLKIKPTHSADFVIGGYTKGNGSRAALGSLLVGYWDRGKLRYASHVGSGFDDALAGRGQGAAGAAENREVPVRAEARSERAGHLGGAQARRRDRISSMDGGRFAPRAGFSALARRHRSETRAARRSGFGASSRFSGVPQSD